MMSWPRFAKPTLPEDDGSLCFERAELRNCVLMRGFEDVSKLESADAFESPFPALHDY